MGLLAQWISLVIDPHLSPLKDLKDDMNGSWSVILERWGVSYSMTFSMSSVTLVPVILYDAKLTVCSSVYRLMME